MNLLLAEDDAVSHAFLCEVLRAAGHSVTAVADGRAALRLAKSQTFDLLLLDLHLPGLRGDQLLAALRDEAMPGQTAGQHAPAIALTADLDAAQRARLLAAGFTDAIGKPMSGDTLVALVAGQRANQANASAPCDLTANSKPLWDDDAALAVAGGSWSSVAALRGLFRNELPAQRQRMMAAIDASDAATLAGELHRLRASCGFCGAAKLGEIARALSAKLARGQSVDSLSSDALIAALDAVLQSLDEPTTGDTTTS